MHSQIQNPTTPGSGHGPAVQTAQFHHDTRTPYGPVYSPTANVGRDGNGSQLQQMFSNMNLQTPRAKFGPKPPATMAVNTNMGPSYNGQYVLVPNSTFFGGLPQVSSFVPGSIPSSPDQLNQFQYFSAGMYPGLNSMVPGAYSPLPYVVNYDMQDVANNKQAVWASADGQKASQVENNGQIQYYTPPFMPGLDGAPLPPYSYANLYPPLGPLALPFQMMKTTNGYVVQDLEALTQQEPGIPRAVPAMWTNPSELTLAKCLENREGITNVYIRGFLPETTDEMLHAYAARFGKIERCKAIVDLDTGLCKGFGFVQYYNFESCENCIRGFFYLGYQASFAQKSRNSRLKDLEDKTSTNIYCTNLPIEWTEADLRRHFEPYRVVSEKISRDEKTGVSKEVGFARFESREIAERVLNEFHNVTKDNRVRLMLRFADTKAQKMLKQQSNERRAYRAGEYNYSVEVVQGSVQGSTPSPSLHRFQGPVQGSVQGSTPSPSLHRVQGHVQGSVQGSTPSPSMSMHRANQTIAHLTPNSQGSYTSPAGVGSNWTPATSISPTVAMMKNSNSSARQSSLSSRSANPVEHTPVYRARHFGNRRSLTDISGGSSKTVMPDSPTLEPRSYMSSPRKENMSPRMGSGPRSCT